MAGVQAGSEALQGQQFLLQAACLTLERAFNETPASPMELKSRPHTGLDFWLEGGDGGLSEGEGVLRFPIYCLNGYIVEI